MQPKPATKAVGGRRHRPFAGPAAIVCAIWLVLAGRLAYGQNDTATAVDAPTKVVVLGTGTPNPDPERSGPAIAVVAGERAYIVDAGPGLVRRAQAAADRHDIAALEAGNLGTVFLTHLHSDHTAGLADIWLSPWVLGRNAALRLIGPPGTEHMAKHFQEAYREDIRARLYGPEPINTIGYRIDAKDAAVGMVYSDDTVKVRALQVPHGSWPHAYAYRFETGDRTVVISGDTTYSEDLIAFAKGADLLLHEVYSAVALEKRTPDWQRYHAAFHTSTVQLAKIASAVQPGRLVLYHQLYWGRSDADLIAEIREAGYDGPLSSATDLGVY